jgi:hypothetical protein
MSTVADILAARKPKRRRVRLLLDGVLSSELERTRREVALSSTLDKSDQNDLDARLTELTSQADEASKEFEFQAISRAELERLKSEFPPSEDQWDRYKTQVRANPLLSAPDFDPEALAPVLMAACCVDPVMTRAEAEQVWDSLSDGEAAVLFEAAWSVNQEATTRPLALTVTDVT